MLLFLPILKGLLHQMLGGGGGFIIIKKERLRQHHVDLYEVLFQHKLCCKMAVSLGIKRRNTKWKKITDSSRIICLNPYSV